MMRLSSFGLKAAIRCQKDKARYRDSTLKRDDDDGDTPAQALYLKLTVLLKGRLEQEKWRRGFEPR